MAVFLGAWSDVQALVCPFHVDRESKSLFWVHCLAVCLNVYVCLNYRSASSGHAYKYIILEDPDIQNAEVPKLAEHQVQRWGQRNMRCSRTKYLDLDWLTTSQA